MASETKPIPFYTRIIINLGKGHEKVSEGPVEPRVCSGIHCLMFIAFITQIKYSEEQLREKLSEEEYNVTQNKGTERLAM